MDLRAPAVIENRTLLEWSVISNNSRSLAVLINYITQVISWAVCWVKVVTDHWSKTCEGRVVRTREDMLDCQIPILKKKNKNLCFNSPYPSFSFLSWETPGMLCPASPSPSFPLVTPVGELRVTLLWEVEGWLVAGSFGWGYS